MWSLDSTWEVCLLIYTLNYDAMLSFNVSLFFWLDTCSHIILWIVLNWDYRNPFQKFDLVKLKDLTKLYFIISSVQSLSHVRLLTTPWTTECQASLSITNSWSSPKLTSIESVMPSNHLILCRPLLLLPSIFPSIRIFSNESALRTRWPKYWSFSFNISPSNEHLGLMSLRMDWFGLLIVKGLTSLL